MMCHTGTSGNVLLLIVNYMVIYHFAFKTFYSKRFQFLSHILIYYSIGLQILKCYVIASYCLIREPIVDKKYHKMTTNCIPSRYF